MDFYDAWNASLEEIKKKVTGVGVWTALNIAVPVTLEDDVFVIGIPEKESELRGHLQISGNQRIVEQELGKRIGKRVKLEVIDGITINHWESIKRRRAETERLKREAIEKDKKAAKAASNWDNVYDLISREYSALANKAMPQVKARFVRRCVDICVETIDGRALDESDERNLSRVIERISAYTEVSATHIALLVLDRTEAK